MIDWPQFAAKVRAAKSFVLTTHVRPDCDALGSELAMAAILRSIGKQVRIINGDEPTEHLKFLDPTGQILVFGRDVELASAIDSDALMILDTSAWTQLAPQSAMIRQTRGERLLVDHHVSEDDLQAIAFKDVVSPATGCLVVDAADALGVLLAREIAEPALAAIATDTGWFRFRSVRGDTLRTVARLVDAGAELAPLYNTLYEQESLGRVRLRGMILAEAKTECDGKLAYATARLADFAATGAVPADTEDVVNHLLRVAGTEAAVLFTEMEGRVKASLRSRNDVDVRKVAELFGGGGHTQAAGITQAGALADVQKQILDALRAAIG